MQISLVASGQKNVTYRITGLLDAYEQREIKTDQRQLKLASLSWLIEEKMGIYLGWSHNNILLPMESRNRISFDTSILSPLNWDGSLWITPFGGAAAGKALFIIMDFDK